MLKIFISIALVLSFVGCTQKPSVVSSTKKSLAPKKIIKAPAKKQITKIVTKSTPKVISKPVAKQKPKKLSPKAQTILFPTVNNGTIKMSMEDNILYIKDPRYFGEKVYLFLFGRDCPYCRQEIGTVKQIAKTHKVIGVHAHKMIGDGALTRYVKRIGYNFPVLSFKKDIKLIRFLQHNQIWDGTTPAIIEVDEYGNVKEVELYSLLK